MNTRETDDNSQSSSVENVVCSAECFDTDAIPRHVHFEQNDGGKNKDNGSSKRTSHENSVEKTEEICLTQALQQAAKPSQEHESTQRVLLSRQNMQNSHIEEMKISSVNLLTNLNLQDKQVELGQRNDVRSSHVALKENRFGNSEQSVKSSFEDQHLKSPGNNLTQRKNPLVHSRTAPSFLQVSNGKNGLNKSEEHEQNNRNKEIRGTYDDDDRSLNNTTGSGNEIIPKPDPNQVDKCSSNIFEMIEKNSYENEGKRQYAMEHDNSKNNFEAENELGNHVYGRSYKQTQNEDSEQENIKDSAGNSVSSSGFESLNQLVSQSNNNRKDIEQTDNSFGVTFVDKENLVVQLQNELNAVRSERSSSEKAREQLLKKAKNLQNQNNQKRNQAKTVWKKKYFEEKKKTASLEERCNQLRYEVEVVHKKIIASTDSKDRDSASTYLHAVGDPKKLNAKIMLTRKENEVEELRRRVEEAKMKLGSEMKLRDNAQKELKQIRDEVIDKKINATLVKKSLSLLETRSPNDL